MEIIASNLIQINEPNQKLLEYCKTTLTFKNPEYSKKLQMGFYVGKTPKCIKLYDYDRYDNILYLPIGCLNDVLSMCTNTDSYSDYTSTNDTNISSNIILRDYQEPCVKALEKHNNGIFLIPCGMGKTECALKVAEHLHQKTLFITHTKDLMNQAKGRCIDKVNCSISTITDGKVDLSGDIVFATVQTLQKKLEEISQDEFGLVVIDEVHHLAATPKTVGMFRECLDYFAAKYKLGLTATLHRADGLEKCIPKLLGDVIYQVVEDDGDYVGIYENKEIIRFPKDRFQIPVKVNFINTEYNIDGKDVYDKNGLVLSFSKLLNDLSMNYKRNSIIINLCNSLKGSTIILSDRVDQLKYLSQYIDNCVQIDGSTKKQVREQALKDVDSGKVKVLLASYKLAKEGLDCKILENVIFATPIKDEAVVIQSIGRIQRPYEGKIISNVYDLIDNVSMLNFGFDRKRKSIYRKKKWI